MPLAGPANKQGRVAGANAAGEPLRFPGALGTAIVECLGMTAAKTGLSEKEARAVGIPTQTTFTHALDHAGYYPGGELMHVKLLAEKETGRLLGAQIVGERGVDKRIDVLAMALFSGLRVTDLENLDLAYAPQFSSAKDPVIMAGFVASNVVRGDVHTITCDELQHRLTQGDRLQVVDVRTRKEFEEGHLPQAKLVPVDELRERLSELDPDQETVVYCRVGLRAYLAARILEQNGFKNVLNLTGGLLSYLPPSR
jgi:rhodanese-related sulfurtransferase